MYVVFTNAAGSHITKATDFLHKNDGKIFNQTESVLNKKKDFRTVFFSKISFSESELDVGSKSSN
jgi:hypothetical protein